MLAASSVVFCFYTSCGSGKSPDQGSGNSEQSSPKNLSFQTGVDSPYAYTVTGTRVTWYTRAYHQLAPAAQRIIRLHEEVHQQQNPFVQSSPCREVPAYALQIAEARLWLAENDDGKRVDKELQDVQRLLYDAEELIEHFRHRCHK